MRTAMHLAASTGALKSLEFLLANGGNPNVRDRWGALPLMDAVKGGHHMATLVIKRNGGRLSSDSSSAASGTTSDQLCVAAAEGNVAMLQLLRDAGVDLNQASALRDRVAPRAFRNSYSPALITMSYNALD
eukprot:scaffold647945_cov47-Prasinocladus_malaysianus.AAC.2